MMRHFDRVKFAKVLTSHGYGSWTEIVDILSKLTQEEVVELIYVCSRAAEKLGPEAFYTHEADGWNYEQERFAYLFNQ